jgi:uncharacterized membrane protein
MTNLLLALIAFVGSHFVMSHPLRRPLVGALGEKGFLPLYSLVSAVTLVWIVFAFRAAPRGAYLWAAPPYLWTVAAIIMLIAAILLVGGFFGNPAFPHPEADGPAPQAKGVFGITRHPMMWAFALWAIAHSLVAPYLAELALTFGIGFLSLVGAAMQDRKKAALQPTRWPDWTARTSFIPYGRGWAWPGLIAIVGGIVLWLVATWLHPISGAPPVAPWIWLSA